MVRVDVRTVTLLPAGSTGAPSKVWIKPMTTFRTMDPTTSTSVGARGAVVRSVTATVERADIATVVSVSWTAVCCGVDSAADASGSAAALDSAGVVDVSLGDGAGLSASVADVASLVSDVAVVGWRRDAGSSVCGLLFFGAGRVAF